MVLVRTSLMEYGGMLSRLKTHILESSARRTTRILSINGVFLLVLTMSVDAM